MARAASNLFTAPKIAPTSINRDGFPSFLGTIEEDCVQTLLSNTLGHTFYADAKQMLAEASDVHDRMLRKDAKFFSQALVYARQKGFMRTQPIFGLVKLAAVDPALFARVFDDVILTPNDLADFTTILKSQRKGSEGGRAVKTAAGKWMIKNLGTSRVLDNGDTRDGQYWAIKYGAEKDEGAYSLKDMMQVYHPNVNAGGPRSRPRSLTLFDYIMGGQKISKKDGKRSMDSIDFGEIPQIEQFELLKRAQTDAEKVQAIQLGHLPHEVATSFAGTSKDVWNAIVPNMPIFALLRNLATLERHGVLESNKKLIQRMFTDEKTITRSKILPFRFIEASKHVQAGWVQDALRDAVELAFTNVPDLEGKTAVMLDVSPSMKQGHRSDDMMRHASIFAVALMKKAQGDGDLICFDAIAFPTTVSMRDSVLTQADRVAQLGANGGTNQTAAIEALGKKAVDQMIIITDGEQNAGRPFVDALEDYRQRVNKNVKVFIMDVSPYRNQIVPSDAKNRYIFGWNDQTMQFISMSAKGWGSQVQLIKQGIV